MTGDIMARAKSYEMDMTRGAILPKLIIFSLPLMASGVLQLLFNAADVAVVGRFVGAGAMAAVGSTSSLISLLINFFIGLSVGVNVCVARYYAVGEDADMAETVSTAVCTALISGIVLIFIGAVLARPMLELMGSPGDVIEESTRYLRIYFIGMPAVMLYNFISAVFRAVGDTKRPLYFQLIAGVVNVLLNLFFVLVLKIGVAGVAIATTVSQGVSAVGLAIILVHEKGRLHLDLRSIRIHWDKLIGIFKVGLPAGLQSTLFSLSNVIIQSAINSFGSTAMAGSTASSNIEGFVYVSMNSIYQTNLSFSSQNMGAGKYSRINRILAECLLLVAAVGIFLGVMINVFSYQLLSLYTKDPLVIEYGRERLSIIAGAYFLCGMMDTMVGSLRGMGYSMEPMIVSFLGACGSRILYILTLFQLPFFHTLSWLYIGYPVSWALTFLCHLIIFILLRRKYPRTDAAAG